MPGPLDGIRVIDFTHALAAPFGTMVLADLGAEVINVVKIDERDETRGPGPFVNGRSTFRFSIERGKKGIQIDLKRPVSICFKCDDVGGARLVVPAIMQLDHFGVVNDTHAHTGDVAGKEWKQGGRSCAQQGQLVRRQEAGLNREILGFWCGAAGPFREAVALGGRAGLVSVVAFP